MRRLTALALVAAVVLSSSGAGADDALRRPPPPAQPRTRVDGPTIVASAHAPALAVRRVAGRRGRSASVKVRCTYYHVPASPEDAPGWFGPGSAVPAELVGAGWVVVEGPEPTVLVAPTPEIGELVVVRHIPPEGGRFLRICRRGETEVSNEVVEIGPRKERSTPQWLAEHDVDWDDVPLPEPTVFPHKALALFPAYLSVADWGPARATAEVTNLVVEVEATPVRATWAMGDGKSVACAGPGSRVDTTRPVAERDRSCTHTYRTSSYQRGPGHRFEAGVTVTYEVRWWASDGAEGRLGDIEVVRPFLQQVQEIQVVNVWPVP
ncbi:MAG: hypothetical protein ACRD0F_03585 [Acidimicrobiales bacterium]